MSIMDTILLANPAVESAALSLRAIRKYQQDRRTHGVKRVDLYFKDVEGDWLESFGEGEDEDLPLTDAEKLSTHQAL
jgi:urate oxidase